MYDINTKGRRSRRVRVLHAVVFSIAMTSFGLHAQATATFPTDFRVVAAGDKFEDTWQLALAYKLRPPRRLRARELELAIGAITTPQETRPFISLGPVWRLPLAAGRFFVDLGFSPTIVAGSSLNGRDLGGNFHFTSSAAVGSRFGSREAFSVSLRVQHTSNGGLNGANPGLDMIGLNFSYDFNQ